MTPNHAGTDREPVARTHALSRQGQKMTTVDSETGERTPNLGLCPVSLGWGITSMILLNSSQQTHGHK